MGMHGNYDLHTGFHGPYEEPEPPDVFIEGEEDGYVWPIEPVLPIEDCPEGDPHELIAQAQQEQREREMGAWLEASWEEARYEGKFNL